MAHQLTVRKNGTAEMAYAGEGAWHGLGQQLERGASIEQWRAAAGMDWKVCRSRVRFGEGDNRRVWDDNHVLFRNDTKAPLGIVSPKFEIVQPGQVLEFFRDLSADNGFELETAGTLFGGKRFWALANIGERAVIGHADMVGGYLLLVTGADGSLATTARFTTVRVVCNNTLSMALSTKDKNEIKVSHRSAFDAGKVKDQLGIGRGQFAKFTNAMRDLSRVKLTVPAVSELTAQLLAPELFTDKGRAAADRATAIEKVAHSKGYRTVLDLFNGKGLGANLAGAQGTAWGWVNAVTQYVDYEAPARNQDNRLNSAWFGNGDDLKTEAVELALATV